MGFTSLLFAQQDSSVFFKRVGVSASLGFPILQSQKINNELNDQAGISFNMPNVQAELSIKAGGRSWFMKYSIFQLLNVQDEKNTMAELRILASEIGLGYNLLHETKGRWNVIPSLSLGKSDLSLLVSNNTGADFNLFGAKVLSGTSNSYVNQSIWGTKIGVEANYLLGSKNGKRLFDSRLGMFLSYYLPIACDTHKINGMSVSKDQLNLLTNIFCFGVIVSFY
jgi:hypothetical protein